MWSPFWTSVAFVWETVSWWRGLINRTRDHRADCCHFLLYYSTSLLGELNKTGQFGFLFHFFFSYFLVFIDTSSRDFGFSFPFTAGFNLPHSQNNISYPIAFKKKKKKKLQIGSASLSFWKLLLCMSTKPKFEDCTIRWYLFASEKSSSFFPFQSPWVHTNSLGERVFFPP